MVVGRCHVSVNQGSICTFPHQSSTIKPTRLKKHNKVFQSKWSDWYEHTASSNRIPAGTVGASDAKQSNGHSIQAFCTEEGISKNTYFYWQRKLREATCTKLVKQADEAESAFVPNGWGWLERPDPVGI